MKLDPRPPCDQASALQASTFHPLRTPVPGRVRPKLLWTASARKHGPVADHDEPEQEALFYIEGPDERGCVWMHGASSKDPWAQNLGPARKVAEVLSSWLASIDDEETRNEFDAEEARQRDA